MRFLFCVPLVAAYVFSLSGHCLPSPADDGTVTLLPINLGDFEGRQGIQRRANSSFTALDPATHVQLVYGNKGGEQSLTFPSLAQYWHLVEKDQLLLADMTLHAPEGLAIVLMEKLNGLTKNLDCNADDGLLALTFKSKDAFDQALQKWSFINQREDKNLIFIANHDGCGPDDERQPYQLVFRIRKLCVRTRCW